MTFVIENSIFTNGSFSALSVDIISFWTPKFNRFHFKMNQKKVKLKEG